jgi:competence protein ComEA
MKERLRLFFGFASLSLVLGSGVLMTLFSLKQSEAQVSQAELAELVKTVNTLVAERTSVSSVPAPVTASSQPEELVTSPAGRIAINHASAAELDRLPGIGPVRAKNIFDARAAGPFRDLDDIRVRVPKVPASVLEDIAPLITFDE